ncbi:peptidase M56 [Paenibacillus sp. JNUCC31]|uniref:M56 family metallopeptidase n=1 Tax=Paenibacillus sp. JNUCC-31 TaxID=2777983 RepID=UPI001783F592|nr:M56 family metallopeptidase [Paenibacillus sp. JNUCC-31]QOS78990.1 peptidase M56 [Paenibacillus sp. JNUCC-31]
MNTILVLLSTLTVAGSVVVAFILLLRLFSFQAFPAKWRFGIGKMALGLYLLPIFFASHWVFTRFISNATVTKLPLTVEQGLAEPFYLVPSIPVQSISANLALSFICVWAAGAIVFAAWQIYGYHRFLKKLELTRTIVPKNSEVAELLPVVKRTLGLKSEVRLAYSSMIRSPFLIGLWKPTIYLPLENAANVDLTLVLHHELIHLKRKDLWVKALILVARGLHWFNPLIHTLSRDIHIWSELSCDEEVVKGMSIADRKRYGEMILNVVAGSRISPTPLCSSLSGDGKQLKRRLTMMLNVKKVKKKTFVIAISALFLVTAISTVTTAWASSNTPRVVASEETTSGVPRPSAQAEVREDASVVPRSSAQAEAREETSVAPRPSAQAEAREEPSVAPRPSAQAEAREEASVAPRPSAQAEVREDASVAPRPSAQAGVRGEASAAPRPPAQAEVREAPGGPRPSAQAEVQEAPAVARPSAQADASH